MVHRRARGRERRSQKKWKGGTHEHARRLRSPKSGKGDSKDNQSGDAAKKIDAITLLKNDHRKVEQLFQQYEQSDRRAEKQKLARQICQELIVHTKLEEEIFYPSCREQRRGWDRFDHEGSGWYGDSDGHSEPARRGWKIAKRHVKTLE